jgi:CheY-like chemotaxis protein
VIALQIQSHPVPLCSAAAAVQSGKAASEPDDSQEVRMMRPLRVLIVEDEFYISLHTRGLLQALGHVVVAVAVSADQAVTIADSERPDVVLMDIRLTGSRDGIDAADEISNRFGIASIFVTANTDYETRRRAEAVHPLGFLEKPLTEQRLRLGLGKVAH